MTRLECNRPSRSHTVSKPRPGLGGRLRGLLRGADMGEGQGAQEARGRAGPYAVVWHGLL